MTMELVGLFKEFVIGHHTVFHKQAKAFPFFFKLFSVFVENLFQLVGYFFGDMVIDLSHIRIALQIASANVQRNIGLNRSRHAAASETPVQYLSLHRSQTPGCCTVGSYLFVSRRLLDFREIQNSGEVERIITLR